MASRLLSLFMRGCQPAFSIAGFSRPYALCSDRRPRKFTKRLLGRDRRV
jgi:hypothetical protein